MIELIDYIYVHENGNITIKFKFEDEFKSILEYIKDNKLCILKEKLVRYLQIYVKYSIM